MPRKRPHYGARFLIYARQKKSQLQMGVEPHNGHKGAVGYRYRPENTKLPHK